MQESEFAEHRIPVEEKPFWNEDGPPISLRHSFFSSRHPPVVRGAAAGDDDRRRGGFDWNGPFIRTSSALHRCGHSKSASRLRTLTGHSDLSGRFPGRSQDEGRGPLKELLEAKQCEIGAQLHPWVNPPFVEVISNPQQLSPQSADGGEYDKLLALTNMLEEAFGMRRGFTAPDVTVMAETRRRSCVIRLVRLRA